MRYGKLKKDGDPEKILKKKGKKVTVYIYASCAEDEVATENVFTTLLKGQKPDDDSFYKLKTILYDPDNEWKERT